MEEMKMKLDSFEDIQVWQDARVFVKEIYSLTSLEKFKKDFGLKDQIQRASVSVLNNISEGFERNNNKEFIKFLLYAKGSAGEIRAMLYIALDINYIKKEEFDKYYNNAIKIITQLSNFITYLRKTITKNRINKIKSFLFFSPIFIQTIIITFLNFLNLFNLS
jgi:four helix bundle protein